MRSSAVGWELTNSESQWSCGGAGVAGPASMLGKKKKRQGGQGGMGWKEEGTLAR